MAIIVNFAGASLLKPGAYSDVRVAGSSVSNPALGVVALIGESDEGDSFANETGLSAVSYGPDEFAAIVDKYGSGPLVDAAKLAISPSNDPAIRGGAQELVLLKTNASTKASLALPSAYGTLSAKKAGEPGNKISVAIANAAGQRVITINDLQKGKIEVSAPIGGTAVLTVQCTDAVATAATLTIDGKKLTTTVTGGSTQPLSISLAGLSSIAKLADMINQFPGYAASVASAQLAAKPVSDLDQVTALDIKTAAASVNRDAADVAAFFAGSSIVDFAPAKFAGLPGVMARTFLAGGAKGATSPAAIQSAIDALMGRRINFLVPLFSRDAAADIADSLTDAGSTYDIHAIHAAVAAHVNQGATVKGRKERQGFVGFKGTFAASQEAASMLNAARVQMCFQDVDVLHADGSLSLDQPHMLAVLSAAMKASALPGLSNTFKAPSISGFKHTGFDPETQADQAIAANLCFVEKAPAGGFRFVLDNSTYQSDKDAWIYNRPSVIYAADLCAYTLRLNTEQFVGVRNSDVSKQSVENLLVGVFDSLRSAGLIVADANTGGRGYKDLNVKINGSIITIDVTLALVENVEFILSDIKVQRAG